jgi:hypothetical protein
MLAVHTERTQQLIFNKYHKVQNGIIGSTPITTSKIGDDEMTTPLLHPIAVR